MMKLPEKFQFRNVKDVGYTHTASIEGNSVKVKWARGWFESRGEDWHNEADSLWTSCTLEQAQDFADEGVWNIVVEDKKVEQELPDEFDFYSIYPDTIYTAVRDEAVWKVWKKGLVGQNEGGGATYGEKQIKQLLEGGYYNILKRVKITPEQLRSNAEFREQIAALDHSIRLAYQDIEHKQKLINSYLARQGELSSKLVKES